MIKLLHVEDDQDIREITQLSLALSNQFEVRQCESGPEALEVAAEFLPDLILLDVMMPGMSGPELLDAFRKLPALANVPVVFMTARVQPSELQAFLDRGAVDVIAKPFDPVSLGDRVISALEKSKSAA